RAVGSGSFFFSSRRRHTRFSRDWSSDVCSSDLTVHANQIGANGKQFQWRAAKTARRPGLLLFERYGDLEFDFVGDQRHGGGDARSEEHTSGIQSRENIVCRLLLEKKNGLQDMQQ